MIAERANASLQAVALGFTFDERLQKWRHPLAREYSALRAKHAVEDYPTIVRNAGGNIERRDEE